MMYIVAHWKKIHFNRNLEAAKPATAVRKTGALQSDLAVILHRRCRFWRAPASKVV
jgi:hypothetical protein